MAQSANIANRVRAFIPATFEALTSATYYGLDSVQQHVDTVKFRLFATVVPQTLEATVYNPFVLDYAAKVATLNIIPSGADFWSDQMQTETAHEQTQSFPDRIASLWRIHERLLSEVRRDEPIFLKYYPTSLIVDKTTVPAISSDGQPDLTVDPVHFGGSSTQARFGATIADLANLPWTGWA